MTDSKQCCVECVDVAIIGGGFSGVAVAYHLLSEVANSSPGEGGATLRVCIFEPRGELGAGIAYGTDREEHLLNVRASGMSISNLVADDFVAWLRVQHPHYHSSDFVPRMLYRNYLQERLAAVERVVADRVVLGSVSTQVVSLRRLAQGGFELRDAEGVTFGARGVVLALGNLPFTPPFVARGSNVAGLFASPWREDDLERASRATSVAIIGSSLTAVDTVLALEGKGCTANYTLISRHGLLPQAHVVTKSPSGVGSEWLGRIIAASSLREMVREFFAAVRAKRCWRSLIDDLRPSLQGIWRRWSLTERRRFLRHLRHRWDTVRHRIPEASAATMERLRREGRLRIIAGSVRDVSVEALPSIRGGNRESQSNSPLRVAVAERRDGEVRAACYDVVFNCIGLIPDLRSSDSPLLSQMIADGCAAYDSMYCGLRTDECGEILTREGKKLRSCFTLGPLRRGELWETTAAREIREQALAIAQKLVAQLGLLRCERNSSAVSAQTSPNSLSDLSGGENGGGADTHQREVQI